MFHPRQFFEKIDITQKQAVLAVLFLYFSGAVFFVLSTLIIAGVENVRYFSGGFCGVILFGGAWFLYYKYNWQAARYIATLASTLLVTLSLPEPFVSQYVSVVVVMPVVLGLILTGPAWVLLSAVLTIGILLLRSQGSGVYTEPPTLVLYTMIVGGLLIRQLIGDTSLRKITEAEEQTKQNQKRFRSLVENSSVQVSILDASGRLLYESPLASPILGYRFEEHLGKIVFEFVHPDDQERVQESLARLVEDPDLQLCERFRVLHTNGSWRWIEAIGKNLLADPAISGIIINYQDATERVEAEEQILKQLKRLKGLRLIDKSISSTFDLKTTLDVVLQQVISLLNVDAAAVLLVNHESQTVEYAASRGFRSQALRYTRLAFGKGHAGRAVLERQIIHISNVMETSGELAAALRSADESFSDYWGAPLIVKGQIKGVLEIYHRCSLQADPEWEEFLETLAGQAAIAIDNAQLFDSLQTANAELECRVAERTAELYRTNAELEHANRAKDEFLANMSHELRTPLNSILGLAESLLEQRRGTLNHHQEKSLQIIESSGRHLLDLINDILDLSKIDAGMFDFYPQPLLVDEFCRSCLAFVRSQATKKSISVTYANESPISRIFADPRRLKQIIVNLLSNAVKFTPEKGQVLLKVKADVEQDFIQFSVIDNGIGIASEDLQRLFQPFVQLDSSSTRHYEGTGLGLAIVQKLTDLHGGSVYVESTIGRGSCFTINLPCNQDEITKLESVKPISSPSVDERSVAKPVLSEPAENRATILLAEDNPSSVLTVSEYLTSYGYKVVIAHDGIEAVERAEATHPDIILMDIQMPAMNGLQAIARLRSTMRFAATPIVALTALAMPGDRERCLLAGASDYMSKPVSLNSLRQIIQRYLEAQPMQ